MKDEYKINCYDEDRCYYYITERGTSYYIGRGGVQLTASELLSNKHWIASPKDAQKVIDKLTGKCIYIGGE